MQPTLVDLGLFALFAVVLIGPLVSKPIEHNLEVFLFLVGALGVTIAGIWHLELLREAAAEPVLKGIVPAVLVAGLLFHFGRDHIRGALALVLRRLPLKVLVFLTVVALGLASSIVTAIIAALVLVEVVNALPLERRARVGITVVACFAIGLGASLTPVGEPLSTIAITKLKGEPYHADFFFLLRLLGEYVVPGILAFAALGALLAGAMKRGLDNLAPHEAGHIVDVFARGIKVYIFVAALILLGGAFKVLIDKYVIAVPAQGLYWINISSAVLDNATLTAAEIGPSLKLAQIQSALLGLLVAGGMLIPGNIPNIIAANRLAITSKEWARIGVPIGIGAMLLYFVWLYYLPF